MNNTNEAKTRHGVWSGDAIWEDPIGGCRQIAAEIHYATDEPTREQWQDGVLLTSSWEPTRLGMVIQASEIDFWSVLRPESIPGSISLPEGVTGWSGQNGEAITAIVFEDVCVKNVSQEGDNIVLCMTAAYPIQASAPSARGAA